MLTKADIDRLDLSERVITGWEAMGGPTGTPAELLRMIDAELRILAGLRASDPARADRLTARYERLALRLRASIN